MRTLPASGLPTLTEPAKILFCAPSARSQPQLCARDANSLRLDAFQQGTPRDAIELRHRSMRLLNKLYILYLTMINVVWLSATYGCSGHRRSPSQCGNSRVEGAFQS